MGICCNNNSKNNNNKNTNINENYSKLIPTSLDNKSKKTGISDYNNKNDLDNQNKYNYNLHCYYCNEPLGKNYKIRTCKEVLFSECFPCFFKKGDKGYFKCARCKYSIYRGENYYHCFNCNIGRHLKCSDEEIEERNKRRNRIYY